MLCSCIGYVRVDGYARFDVRDCAGDDHDRHRWFHGARNRIFAPRRAGAHHLPSARIVEQGPRGLLLVDALARSCNRFRRRG